MLHMKGPNMLHVICTWFRLGHLSIDFVDGAVGRFVDSSWIAPLSAIIIIIIIIIVVVVVVVVVFNIINIIMKKS